MRYVRQVYRPKIIFLLIILLMIFVIFWFNSQLNFNARLITVKESNEIYDVNPFEEFLNHDVIDFRLSSCRKKKFAFDENKKVSIVIAFRSNEKSILLKTLASIFHRTPSRLLQEIILVKDKDNTEKDNFHLSNILRNYSKIKYIQNTKIEGLAKLRNIGANLATGYYVLFLNSNCEVNQNWLEPLLNSIQIYNGIIVSPILDKSNEHWLTFNRAMDYTKNAFDWNLKFWKIPSNYIEMDLKKDSDEYWTPLILNGVFMISKKWFLDLSSFDNYFHSQIYGSLEFSLRTWMCGGEIAIVPCSRIASINQSQIKKSENDLRDRKRIAELWLDEYKHLFYSSNSMARNLTLKDTPRYIFEVQKRLNCRNFKWYLEIILPELKSKMQGKHFRAFGKLNQGPLCVHGGNETHANAVFLDFCYGNRLHWSHTESGLIMLEFFDSIKCLTAKDDKVLIGSCSAESLHKWNYFNGHLCHKKYDKCLQSNGTNSELFLTKCQQGLPEQLWRFSVYL